jgi:hypothetical protein
MPLNRLAASLNQPNLRVSCRPMGENDRNLNVEQLRKCARYFRAGDDSNRPR